jgi:2-succinyl-5-enolpyruvyl-6-hydroxy-3-cyclohexene-1-carboxylate synthase
MASGLPYPNLNLAWAGLLFAEWRKRGLELALICPGSRSAPLAVAAASTPGVRTAVAIDERSAAFAALGAASVSGRPVAIVTTSGTAVANLLPAAVEASQRGVPLLIVTADRPPELRETGANQAIPQLGIFGRFVRWTADLPAPDASIELAYPLSMADDAWDRAIGVDGRPGPVHVNAPFREPLAPIEREWRSGREAEVARIEARIGAGGDRPWREARGERPAASAPPREVGAARRLLVALGGIDRDDDRELVRTALAGWPGPIVADLGSSLRNDPALAGRIAAHHDLVLAAAERDADLAASLRPDLVVRIGGPLASKRMNALVNACPTVSIALDAELSDEARQVFARGGRGMLAGLATALPKGSEIANAWLSAGAAASATVDRELAAPATLTEPAIAHAVASRVPADAILLAGSSMPIRDLDLHLPAGASPFRVVANRGASGIDGLVSTAIGAGLASGRPVVALVGDLSALHDLGGLLLARDLATPFTLVIVNNDGGGIFSFLPIAAKGVADAHFERLFGTPHGLGFEPAARMFGLGYRRAASSAELAAALDATVARPGRHLVEVTVPRASIVDDHRSLQAAVLEAIRSAGGGATT